MALKKAVLLGALMLGPAAMTLPAKVDVGISVGIAPPTPRVAPGPIGVAPGPGYVWTNGYWDWVGSR